MRITSSFVCCGTGTGTGTGTGIGTGIGRLIAAAMLAISAASASHGQLCEEQQPISASDAAENDEFGVSAAISGDTVVIGSRRDDNADGEDAGAAYVYVRSGPPGGEVWIEQAKLMGTNTFGMTASESGISVAVSGDTAIVGSWLWPSANATGAAYVFVRSGPPGGEVWTQQAALNNPQFGSFQYFGVSVALVGNTALVGSLVVPGINAGGHAYFFTRSGPPGGESWNPQTVGPSDGVPGDQFGISVALSPAQDTAVVGAWMEDNEGGVDAGSAYIYVKSGNSWIEQDKLTASDGEADDRFGVKVAISDGTIVVGAHLDDHKGGDDAGSAYVFTRSGPSGRQVWTELAKLTASDAAAGDGFGASLSLSGDALIIGATLDDNEGGSDAGSAYVFTRTCSGGGDVWTEQFTLTSSESDAEDWFGGAVTLDGDTAVIGARQDDNAGGNNAGSAYVFQCLIDSPCPTDVTGDDEVGPADLANLLAAWGTDPACAPDFDDDNTVGPSDLAEILANWGPCS